MVCSKSIQDECGKTTPSFLLLLDELWPFFSSILELGTCNTNADTNVDTHGRVYIYIYICTGPTTLVFSNSLETWIYFCKVQVIYSPTTTIMPDFLSLWHCGNSLEALEAFECVLPCDVFFGVDLSLGSQTPCDCNSIHSFGGTSFIECIKGKPKLPYHNLLHLNNIPFLTPKLNLCYPLITCMQNRSSFDFVKITSPPCASMNPGISNTSQNYQVSLKNWHFSKAIKP